MRILFYGINGVGLGHLNRLSCIAAALEGHELLFATNSDMVDFFYRHKIRYVKLPKDLDNSLSTAEDFAYAVPKQSNLKLLSALLDGFAPDTVVFDTHFPEEFALECKSRGIRLFLVLREYDKGFVERFVHSEISSGFERVLIADEPESAASAKHASSPADSKEALGAECANTPLPDNFEFIGPIIRPEKLANPSFRRPTLLIASGGGGHAQETKRFLSASINGALRARKKHRFDIVVVCGPLFRDYEALNSLKGIRVIRFSREFIQLLKAATFVVSQAGYNTVHELIHYDIPCLLLPVARETEAQKVRAIRFAQKGLCLAFADWNAAKVASALDRVFSGSRLRQELEQALQAHRFSNGTKNAVQALTSSPPQQEVSLQGLTLSEAAVALRPVPEKLVLQRHNFSWLSLELLTHFLLHGGCRELVLRLQSPIPERLIPRFLENRLIYAVRLQSLDQLKAFTPMLRALKAAHAPVIAQVEHTHAPLLEALIELRVYTIQLLGQTDASLAAVRLKAQNSLFDVSLRTKPVYPSGSQLAQKELLEVVNLRKELDAKLALMLETKGLKTEIELLEEELAALPQPVPPKKEVRLLEAERATLLSPFVAELEPLQAEIEQTSAAIFARFDEGKKGLSQELNWLYHELHLLLESSGLGKTKQALEEKILLLEANKSELWDQYKPLQARLEELRFRKKTEFNSSKLHKQKGKLELEVSKLGVQINKAWELYKNLQLELEQAEATAKSKLEGNDKFKKLQKLKVKLSKLEVRFGKAMEEFEPVRIQVSLLEHSGKAPKKLEMLRQKKDKVWASLLAPVEKQRDILLNSIRELELDEELKQLKANSFGQAESLQAKKLCCNRQLEKLNTSLKKRQAALAKLTESKEYKALLLKNNAEIARLEKKLKQLEGRLGSADKALINARQELNKLLAFNPRLQELNSEIAKLHEKLKPDIQQPYLDFLYQKRDHLLVSKQLAPKLNKIDLELGKAYRLSEKSRAQPRLTALLHSKLISAGIFDEWWALKTAISEHDKELSKIQSLWRI
jgi:UDP-N-acetylglucosamine--N-acetylmuramyl-(pentapeptide) pyrophosphoryl-undecaprenol N-acetylglucosamine transferase